MNTSFDQTDIAFADKSHREIHRAYFLFRLVGSPWLVRLGSALLRMALWLRLPVSWALKPTVFAHFCGGEDRDDCDAVIRRLQRAHIMSILDYAAEGKEREADFETTCREIMATLEKAATDESIPYAVFKPSGLARFGLWEKLQTNESLTDPEKEEERHLQRRLESICERAAETGVPVMVDAEESWIQAGVDRVVEALSLRYNQEKPLIFNTLQMYRTDRLDYLKAFSAKARAAGVYAAFKLVRGAYLEKERERAHALGLPSPVYDEKPGTDQAFDEAVAFCLENHQDVAVCIATHNEQSCSLAVQLMEKEQIPSTHPHVSFSQLLGMSDHISYTLGALGYRVCKYVPYGPLRTVVPYLIRRAEENTSVSGQTSRELQLIRQEIIRRRKR